MAEEGGRRDGSFKGRDDVESVADVDFGGRMWVGEGGRGVEFGGKAGVLAERGWR